MSGNESHSTLTFFIGKKKKKRKRNFQVKVHYLGLDIYFTMRNGALDSNKYIDHIFMDCIGRQIKHRFRYQN